MKDWSEERDNDMDAAFASKSPPSIGTAMSMRPESTETLCLTVEFDSILKSLNVAWTSS